MTVTRERLSKTAYGAGLLDLFDRLTPFFVKDWGNNDSDTKSENRPGDREQVSTLADANVITSLRREKASIFFNAPTPDFDGVEEDRHALVLDIDHPSWLIPSTTPGHYHLYVEVPQGIDNDRYSTLLTALADAGVIEWGYASASIARGFTSVRLPWVQKERGPKQSD